MNVLTAVMLGVAVLMLPLFLPGLIGDAFPAASEFPQFFARAVLALGAVGFFLALIGGRAT